MINQICNLGKVIRRREVINAPSLSWNTYNKSFAVQHFHECLKNWHKWNEKSSHTELTTSIYWQSISIARSQRLHAHALIFLY